MGWGFRINLRLRPEESVINAIYLMCATPNVHWIRFGAQKS